MKRITFFIALAALLMFSCDDYTKKTDPTLLSIDKEVLRDKIAGGWAGKMLGVTYGAPTEFKAQGCIYEDSIRWVPSDVKGAIWQDDIYVQLTFMETMDKYGIDARAIKFHEQFAQAGYMLWHANVQARKNYYDSIYPPLSGDPSYNLHADDIDFQIEADYIGFICPGMPRTANQIADKIGHIMNYGDGVYGGMFVAGLYSAAFFNNNIAEVVDTALLSIPKESDYAKIVSDVILLHKHYPNDWRLAWRELENKWGKVNICEAGKTFNIDAKLNGAYIVMGLLYGDGDVDKTMEIATRCGQDSDCNPSNAVAVLGIIKGFSGLPQAYQDAVKTVEDSLFVHTSYSFNKAVTRSLDYAAELIAKNGGNVDTDQWSILKQKPEAAKIEEAFPLVVLDKRISIADKKAWKMEGKWKDTPDKQAKYSANAGDKISLSFEGTGVSIEGHWVKDAGMADVYVDGELKRTIDCYYNYAGQEHRNINIYHILNLSEGNHTLQLQVKNERNPKSSFSNIYISGAIVYKTGTKANENYKFPFIE